MATFYEPVKKAPLKYVSKDGTYKKINVIAINDVNISNSFDIPYVRGVVGLFNAIISRMMYFTDKDIKKRAQEKIYFPAWQISNVINRCESQSYNIVRSLERILGIHVSRAHEKAGANVFRLSQRTYEFLHIFTMEKLQEFIQKYNIDSVDQYALKQIYNYRVVRPTDGNLDRKEREEFNSFIKNRKHRDFVHFCSQNNVTPEARVTRIEAHIDFLSDTQKEQLNKIKQILKETPKKLLHYFHWKLIEIQQFITFMLNKDSIIKAETSQEDNTQPSLVVNRNKTEGEQRTTAEVAAAHKKDPEQISYTDIVEIATFWNIMAKGRKIDQLHSLTDSRMESIYKLVKSHGKDNVLYAVKNIGNLHHGENMLNVIQFKDFINNSTDKNSRFNTVLNFDDPSPKLTQHENMRRYDKLSEYEAIDFPEFNSKAEAKAWFKSFNNNM